MRKTALGLLTETRSVDLEKKGRIKCVPTLPIVKSDINMVADVGACQY